MRTTNDTYTDSNFSTFIRDSYQKNSLGYYPLLKFRENLYNICQSKFSEFANSRKDDLKLIVNNKIFQHISISDYFNNSSNDTSSDRLTPIPIINKRKLKNESEKKELNQFQRNVVLMRRIEYTNKMKKKTLKKKYNNQINQIIYIQKMIRGYLVRKVIRQVNIINETLMNFLYLITLCIKKKYFYNLINNISYNLEQNKNDEKEIEEKKYKKESYTNTNTNINLNTNNETITKNDIYNNDNDYKLVQNTKFFDEDNNILENSKNDYDILKEKVKFTDKNINNINEINKDEVDITFNAKNGIKLNNNGINQDKSNKNIYNINNTNKNKDNNYINIYNNKNKDNNNINNINNNIDNNKYIDNNNINKNNYNIKDKRSMALLNAQLNEVKNIKTEQDIINNLNNYNNYNNYNNNNNYNKNIINKSNFNSPFQIDSIIENDEYIDFSGKCSLKKDSKKINIINENNTKEIPNNKNPFNLYLSDISSRKIKKAKTEIIQRQFRKYLSKKGYYGKFDKRKISIIYLLKNMILCNIKIYVFNTLKILYKDIKDITLTQDDNFFNITTERIEKIKKCYKAASEQIKHK